MSNPNPGSSGGGIGPALSERAEAPSDPDWNDQSDPMNGKGMTPDDAAESAFDDWDEQEHGISEAGRRAWGPELQRIAAHEGTNVRDGINTLVHQHISKRYGSQSHRRDAVGAEMDFYEIHPPPETPATPPQVVDEFGDLVGQPEAHPFEDEFLAANPIARDPQVHAGMIRVAEDMVRQNFRPDLDTMLRVTLEQADAEVKRAKAASVQVSGAGNVSPQVQSDDVGAILDELIPRE